MRRPMRGPADDRSMRTSSRSHSFRQCRSLQSRNLVPAEVLRAGWRSRPASGDPVAQLPAPNALDHIAEAGDHEEDDPGDHDDDCGKPERGEGRDTPGEVRAFDRSENDCRGPEHYGDGG